MIARKRLDIKLYVRVQFLRASVHGIKVSLRSTGSIYYRQHNKKLVIMVLQRHVSTHTSHRQATFRTFRF
jgi:hypothetical protein